jgi:CRP/FNR family transcriptional regulator, cyclic AMP receptor protein
MKTHAPYGMELVDDCTKCPLRKAGFFCEMAADSVEAFQKIKFTSSYPTGAVLFVEEQVPRGVYMLCTGRVKLTMTSSKGKTVLLHVAEAGEMMGLDSAISGNVHELTAETLQPCQVDFVRKGDLLNFLREHQDAAVRAMQQISNSYGAACHQIRYLSLTPSATEKVVCFLLESAARGDQTPKGVRFNLSLTHEEVSQVIGLTRESVTRCLADLRTKMLISTKGHAVLIRNIPALEAMVAA